MLRTAKSANVGFSQVVQLFPPPPNLAVTGQLADTPTRGLDISRTGQLAD